MRLLRIVLLSLGLLALVLLIRHFGLESVGGALARIAWWQLALVCLVHGIGMTLDTLGWRCTILADRPPFLRLLAARCAGQAINVATALGGVGGEAVKVWLLRRDLPYEASVPSLILAKTAEVVGQTLLLGLGIFVAWATAVGEPSLLGPMCGLLVAEVVAVGGFVAAQVAGGVGRLGRLLAWVDAERGARRVDGAVRSFYRAHWRLLLGAVGFHLAGWLVGALEALLVLRSLRVPASAGTATVIEALGTGVRFATFFVPASLGALEGANAAAFTALGWSAGDGLAFSLVRRGRQAVWIGIGLVVLGAMGALRAPGKRRVEPAPGRVGRRSPHATQPGTRSASRLRGSTPRSRADAVSGDTMTGNR